MKNWHIFSWKKKEEKETCPNDIKSSQNVHDFLKLSSRKFKEVMYYALPQEKGTRLHMKTQCDCSGIDNIYNYIQMTYLIYASFFYKCKIVGLIYIPSNIPCSSEMKWYFEFVTINMPSLTQNKSHYRKVVGTSLLFL